MPLGGFEPQTLGAASSDEDHYTMHLALYWFGRNTHFSFILIWFSNLMRLTRFDHIHIVKSLIRQSLFGWLLDTIDHRILDRLTCTHYPLGCVN